MSDAVACDAPTRNSSSLFASSIRATSAFSAPVRSTSVAYEAFASAARRASACRASLASPRRCCACDSFSSARALLFIEPRNRFARFALPRLQSLALLLGAASLDFEQLEFLLHLLQIVCRALQLHLEAKNRLLLAMQVGIHGRDGVRYLDDASLERGHVRYRLIALRLFACDAIAQFLDLALDAEDGAPFVLAAARDQHAAAHHVTGQGCDRRRRRSRRVQRAGEVVSNEAVWNDRADRGSVKARDLHDVADGDKSSGRTTVLR